MAKNESAVLHRPHRYRAKRYRANPRALPAGRPTYERRRALPRLLPVTDGELATDDAHAARMLVARLARALRSERQRGRAGHWSYDLNRHIALAQALGAERHRLERLMQPRRPQTESRQAKFMP